MHILRLIIGNYTGSSYLVCAQEILILDCSAENIIDLLLLHWCVHNEVHESHQHLSFHTFRVRMKMDGCECALARSLAYMCMLVVWMCVFMVVEMTFNFVSYIWTEPNRSLTTNQIERGDTYYISVFAPNHQNEDQTNYSFRFNLRVHEWLRLKRALHVAGHHLVCVCVYVQNNVEIKLPRPNSHLYRRSLNGEHVRLIKFVHCY